MIKAVFNFQSQKRNYINCRPKVAAQNCRKRKIDQIEELQVEIKKKYLSIEFDLRTDWVKQSG